MRTKSLRMCTTRAGAPTATAPSGTLLVTTEPAPITAPLPMRTPDNTITPNPNQAWSSMTMGPFRHSHDEGPRSGRSGVVGRVWRPGVGPPDNATLEEQADARLTAAPKA